MNESLLKCELVALGVILGFFCAVTWIHIITTSFKRQLEAYERRKRARNLTEKIMKSIEENK